MYYDYIPSELKQLRQWINWRYDETSHKKKTKLPICAVTGQLASVTNPLQWSSFDHCFNRLDRWDGIGFVFTKSDPYCGVDLDNPENNALIAASHTQTYNMLASYSEISPSGFGIHIIIKAALPGPGRRRNRVEMYDTERFFTFTGNRTSLNGIEYRQREAELIYNSLGSKAYVPEFTLSEPQSLSDAEVLAKASSASNGDKFVRLWSGNWTYDYPPPRLSQSEADFALINIIAFYTKNREQITRLFRMSGLGQRDKAKRDKYVAWMVNRAFDRMPSKPDMDELHNQRLAILASLKS